MKFALSLALITAVSAASNPWLVNPCVMDEFSSADFCDVTLPIDERVKDAIQRMTLEEKIAALGSDTPEIPSLGLNAYNWWSEASTGIATDDNAKTTKFAFPITTGMR